MLITKYPQSNFLIEKNGARILIDPGIFTFEKFTKDDFGKLDAIFLTHQHQDHLDLEAIEYWVNKNIPIFGNSDVKQVLEKQSIETKEVKSGNGFEFKNFIIKPIDLPHCKLLFCSKCDSILFENLTREKKCSLHLDLEPKQIDGPPNTGFVIDNLFFHPGDGIEIENLQVENAAIPIAGPTINFENVWKLAKSLKAKVIVPMHYSSPKFPADLAEFAKENKFGIEVKILADGESTEI